MGDGDDFHLDQIQNSRLGTGQVLRGNSRVLFILCLLNI